MTSSRLERSALIVVGVALAVPWAFIWQGLDFTDQGYLLTSYRCFFRHPEATEDSGGTWLTNLLGASWDALFGGLGVVGMRGLWALCMSIGVLLVFRLVRRVTSPQAAAWAALAASVFLSDRRETWFSYNTSSSLLFVVAAALLLGGMITQQRGQLFAAGVVVGVLPFARFPNVLAAALLSTPCLAAVVFRDRRRGLALEVSVLLAGCASGVLATLGLIHVLGHWSFFLEGIRELFAPAAQQSGYDTGTLLSRFVGDETNALAWGLGVCAAGAALARLLGKVPSSVAWALVTAAAALGVFGLAGAEERWRFVVPGASYWLLGAVALGLWRRSFEQRTLSFIALVIVGIAPLGSNNGIKNAHMGLWLALPLALALLWTLDASALAGQGRKLALLACLVVAGEGLHRAGTYTYRDSARETLLTTVDHPQLRAQFTSPARAKVVHEVLEALERRVAAGDYLLAYEGTPLLQYLTRTRPYLNRPWLMGVVSGDEVTRLAADAPRRTGCLPVAVLTLKTTRSADWPKSARQLEAREPTRSARIAINAFLRAHGYRRTWRNSFFEILEPSSVGPGSCR